MEWRLLVLPREVSQTYLCGKKNRDTANNCCEKSAEAIVDGSNELAKEKNTSEVSQSIEGLNLNQVKVNECYPMKGRKQKISQDNSQGEDRSETESLPWSADLHGDN